MSKQGDFRLGDWWIRPLRNELDRGEQTHSVEARSMEVLVCLARHAPKVVTKEELLADVWQNSPFIGDEVISHAVWELRKALGDSAKSPTYIQTIPRKGYRLLVEVLHPKGSPEPIVGARIDHFDLEEEIGRGSMGVVYRAHDRHLDRTVALKFLAAELTRNPSAVRRFEREAHLAASLDHPNLATVHGIGEASNGQRYLVTSHYPAGSLRDRLAQGPISPSEALDLARQIAAGLRAAHRRDIVHRDIKPANLLLDEHGTLKIADFGIAKLIGATDLTRTGASLGTPAYKSPEQSQGLPVDHRTDLWSLGVVLFELLTGRRPFDGEYDQAVVHSILALDPKPETDLAGRPLPEPLRRIIAKAMAKDPEERYQSAEEILGDLGGAAREPARLLASPESRPRRNRSRFAVGAVAATLLLAGLTWRSTSKPPVSPERLNAAGHFQHAQILLIRGNDSGNLQAVAEQLATARRLDGEWPDLMAFSAFVTAERFGASGDEKDEALARSLLDRARRLDPENPLVFAAAGRLMILDRGYAEAERAARAGIEAWPTCKPSESCDLNYMILGQALWAQGNFERALGVFERGTQVGFGRIRCRLEKAHFYGLADDFPRAVLEYRSVLALDREQSTALNDLAILYRANNQPEKAEPLLQRLFTKTGDPKVGINRGNLLYDQHRWKDAYNTYEEAFRLAPTGSLVAAAAAVALGDVRLETHFAEGGGPWYEPPEGALLWFRRALAMYDGQMDGAHLSLRDLGRRAVCLAKLSRRDEAASALGAVLPRYRELPALLDYAARIAALAGDDVALFAAARRARAEGRPRNNLKDDAAFIGYRKNQDYLRLIGGGSLER